MYLPTFRLQLRTEVNQDETRSWGYPSVKTE